MYGNSHGIDLGGAHNIYFNTIYANNGQGGNCGIYARDNLSTNYRNNINYGNTGGAICNSASNFSSNDHNVTSNPSFVNTGSTPPDLHLNAGSGASGTGAACCGITSDKDEVTRATSPTIGAYEGSGSASPPPFVLPAPTNLRVMTAPASSQATH